MRCFMENRWYLFVFSRGSDCRDVFAMAVLQRDDKVVL